MPLALVCRHVRASTDGGYLHSDTPVLLVILSINAVTLRFASNAGCPQVLRQQK